MVAVGRTRNGFYEWTRVDPEFEAKAYEATEAGTDTIEDEALRRAVQGVEKGIYYQGTLVDKTREYSDTLLERLLKARRPDKYKDRAEHSIEKNTLEQLVLASFQSDEGK